MGEIVAIIAINLGSILAIFLAIIRILDKRQQEKLKEVDHTFQIEKEKLRADVAGSAADSQQTTALAVAITSLASAFDSLSKEMRASTELHKQTQNTTIKSLDDVMKALNENRDELINLRQSNGRMHKLILAQYRSHLKRSTQNPPPPPTSSTTPLKVPKPFPSGDVTR